MRYLLILFIVACAPKPDNEATSKSIRSVWKSSLPNWTLDLSAPGLATWRYWTGGVCESDLNIRAIGNDTFGTMTTSNTRTIVFRPEDPTCSQFDRVWIYSFSTSLVLCPQNSLTQCVEFK